MRFICALILGCLLSWLTPTLSVAAEQADRSAVVIPLHEDINPLSGAIFERKFKQAVDSGVDVIILDIRSPGGWTMVTLELMDLLLEADGVETVAYIDRDAISGAALFSLAADKIYMHPSARIGDAGEIVMGEDGAFRYTEAKSRSVLAQKARDTAAATGRPPTLAEKMTHREMIVFRATHRDDGRVAYFSEDEWKSREDADQWERGPPIREAGADRFFIANGKRAAELGIADGTVADRQELYETLNVRTPVPVVQRTAMDTVVLLLNSGVAAFLLILIGLIALGVELSAPGLGVGGLISVLCFGLFFWSRFLGGTAGWLEVTLFVCGLLFVALEVFVVPGFGVFGIGGLVLTLGSLVMASRRIAWPESGAQAIDLGYDVLLVMGAFLGFVVCLLAFANYMGQIPGLSRLTLQPQLAGVPSDIPAVGGESEAPAWQTVEIGTVGITVSPLRPSGKIQVGERYVDVVTEGDFVDSGTDVKVIAKQGARVVVRTVAS